MDARNEYSETHYGVLSTSPDGSTAWADYDGEEWAAKQAATMQPPEGCSYEAVVRTVTYGECRAIGAGAPGGTTDPSGS